MADEPMSDLAVRAARAEIERDAALQRAKSAEEACRAFYSRDKEAMLDTLHIIGIPARDLADIYRLESDWRRLGGQSLLESAREHAALRAVEEAARLLYSNQLRDALAMLDQARKPA